MDRVEIYINQTHRSPRSTMGAYQYLISMMTSKGLADTKGFGAVEATAHEAELIALEEALKRFAKPCIIEIHSEHGYITQIIKNNWLKKWKENGYQNSKGEQVAHAERLIEIDRMLSVHIVEVVDNYLGSFESWMHSQIEINYRDYMKGETDNVTKRFWRIHIG